MASPYGSLEKGAQLNLAASASGTLQGGDSTSFVFGSCTSNPRRMASSVLTASTWFCCSMTRQSLLLAACHTLMPRGIPGATRFWSDVDFAAAHTRFPPRSWGPVIDELTGTRMVWPAQ